MGQNNTSQEIARPHSTGFYDQNPIHNPEAIELYQTRLAHSLTEPVFTPELLVRRAHDPTTLTPLYHKDYRGREGKVGLGDAFVINYAASQGVDPKNLADPRYKTLIGQAQDKYLGEIDPIVQTGIRSELLRRVKTVASNESDEAGYLELLSALQVYEPVDPKYSMSLVKDIFFKHYIEHCKQSKPDKRVLHRLAMLFAETARNDTRSTPVEIGANTYRLLTVEKAKPKIADSGWIECVGSRRREVDAKRATELCAPVYDRLQCEPPPTIVYKTGLTKTGKGLIAARWAAIEAAVAAKKGADRAGVVASAVAERAPDVSRTVSVLGLAGTLGFLSIGNPSKAEAATRTVAYTTSAPVNMNAQPVSLSSVMHEALAQNANKHIGYGPKAEAAIKSMIKEANKNNDGLRARSAVALRFFMKEGGLPLHQAVAPIGNFKVESASTMDPHIHQFGGEVGRGIAQWSAGGRWDTLLRFAANRHMNPTDLNTQLKFTLYELSSNRSYAMKRMKQSTNIYDATYAFGKFFEAPANLSASINARVKFAQETYDTFTRHYGNVSSVPVTRPKAATKPAPTHPVAKPARPSTPEQVSLDMLNVGFNTSPSDANVVTSPQTVGDTAAPAMLVDLGLLQNPDGNNGTPTPDAQKPDVSPPSVVIPNPAAASPTPQQIELTPPVQQPIPPVQAASPPSVAEATPPQQQPTAQPAMPSPAASPEVTTQPDSRNPAALPLLTALGALSIDPNSAQATGNGSPDASAAPTETVAPDPSSVAVASTPIPDVSPAPVEVVDISQIAISPPPAPAPIAETSVPKVEKPASKAPVRVETTQERRAAEVGRLKASGEFNKSQAKPGAPRTPLEKRLIQQGEKNGRLTTVVPLGRAWKGQSLQATAADAFLKMNAAFRADLGYNIPLNDSYRSYSRQVATKADAIRNGRSQFAASPGNSKHGWGLAIDGGGQLQSFNSRAYKWMIDNAINFGWNHPDFADNSSSPEPWHWEFVGTV